MLKNLMSKFILNSPIVKRLLLIAVVAAIMVMVGSFFTIRTMSAKIDSLNREISSYQISIDECQRNLKSSIKAAESLRQSVDVTAERIREKELAFDVLEREMQLISMRKCDVSKQDENENPENDRVIDSIDRTFGLLKGAYCLSGGSCDSTGVLPSKMRDDGSSVHRD